MFMRRRQPPPRCLGLIVAQGVCVHHIWVELVHPVSAAFGRQAASDPVLRNFAPAGTREVMANATVVMLVALSLIDVVLISNPVVITGISSIRLLKTFINAAACDGTTPLCQTASTSHSCCRRPRSPRPPA
jgi:uncharacterized membrane protein YqhA